jgi:hypothetical protein
LAQIKQKVGSYKKILLMNLIDKFNEYFNKLQESLNSPQDISWVKDFDNFIGNFEINDNKYRIEYLKQIGENYSYSFSILKDGKWSYDVSNIGDGFKVLSTITNGISFLFEKTNPDSITFSAIDENDTRKRLYERFCNDFCKKNNFKLSNRGTEEIIIFVLFNDMLSNDRKELIFQSVKKIIEEGK